jgi:hypothetical protein
MPSAWGGYTTHDLARCRLAARMVALVYNWWNLFTRLAEPEQHLEAVTSRPLLLTAIAERIRHVRQTTLRIASTHAKAGWATRALAGIAAFLGGLINAAEQLTGSSTARCRRRRDPVTWSGCTAASRTSAPRVSQSSVRNRGLDKAQRRLVLADFAAAAADVVEDLAKPGGAAVWEWRKCPPQDHRRQHSKRGQHDKVGQPELRLGLSQQVGDE